MDDLTKLAISKSLDKSLKGFKAEPGVHNIDTTVSIRVQGTIAKGADAPYTPTVDIPMLPTLAIVLEKAGFQRETAKRLLIEAMTEALAAGEQAAGPVADRVKDIETAMTHVRQVTNALPKKIKSGATTVKITIEELDM
jgi:hypothetical protein